MDDSIKINRAELMQQVDKLLQENERLKEQVHDLESLRNQLISDKLGHGLELKELDNEIDKQAKRIEELKQEVEFQKTRANTNAIAFNEQSEQIKKLEGLLGDVLAGFQQFGTIYSKDEERIKQAIKCAP